MNPNREHKVDRLFREGIGAGNVPPPPDVWRNVAAEIAGEPKRRRGAWWMFAAGAAVASLFAAIGFGLSADQSATNKAWAALESGKSLNAGIILPADSCTETSQRNAPLLAEQSEKASGGPAKTERSIYQANRGLPVVGLTQYRPEADLSFASPGDKPLENQPNPKPNPKPRDLREMLDFPLQPSIDKGKPSYAQQFPNRPLESQPDLFAPLPKTKESKWALAGNFSPDFLVSGDIVRGINESFSATAGMTNDQMVNLSSESYNSTSRKRMATAYSAGLRVGFGLAPKVQVQTGINFASRSGEVPLTGVNDNGEADPSQTGYSVYSAQLIEMPVLLRFNWLDGKKVDLFVSSGPSVEWLLKGDEYVEYKGIQIAQDTPDQSIVPQQLNWAVGTGIEILPIPRVGIQLEPMVRFGLLNSNVPGQTGRTIGTSLNTGLNFHF